MDKSNKTVIFLLGLACVLNGMLAGGDIYRYLIEVPAWRKLDILLWKDYSAHADMGNGIYLFPVEAIGGAILLIIASFKIFRGPGLKPIAIPVYISTAFALIGLVFTFFAAPVMMSLRSIGSDRNLVQQSFEKFHFWGLLRAIAQTVSFLYGVVALVKTYKIE